MYSKRRGVSYKFLYFLSRPYPFCQLAAQKKLRVLCIIHSQSSLLFFCYRFLSLPRCLIACVTDSFSLATFTDCFEAGAREWKQEGYFSQLLLFFFLTYISHVLLLFLFFLLLRFREGRFQPSSFLL